MFMRRIHLHLILLLAAFFVSGTAHACTAITAANQPAGWGAAHNVYSSASELIVRADCRTGEFTPEVGSAQTDRTNFAVYTRGYYYDGGSWRSLSYSPVGGAEQFGDWILGNATGDTVSYQDRTTFFVAYTCHWRDSSWSCGCQDAGCGSPAWQLQAVTNPDSGVFTGGGDARISVVAEGLEVPWDIIFLPGREEVMVTERPGSLVFLPGGAEIEVPGVEETSEGGLLGAALHPDFATNNLVYLFQTTADGDGLDNRIVRYRLSGRTLTLDRIILEGISGAAYHDGGRMEFGPDGYLYVTIGDATEPRESQDRTTVEGTILRMTTEGDPAPGNPFGNLVYSYGHRNPQGLAWDGAGRLWSNEHGRSGSASGLDEINLITAGGNYGWPDYEGDRVGGGTIGPVRHSGADTTWAPGGLAYLDGKLYMTGLRGSRLYEATLSGTDIVGWDEHFVGEYGRLRDVMVGPDGFLYVTTSNRDGRADPDAEDDRILRINPDRL